VECRRRALAGGGWVRSDCQSRPRAEGLTNEDRGARHEQCH